MKSYKIYWVAREALVRPVGLARSDIYINYELFTMCAYLSRSLSVTRFPFVSSTNYSLSRRVNPLLSSSSSSSSGSLPLMPMTSFLTSGGGGSVGGVRRFGIRATGKRLLFRLEELSLPMFVKVGVPVGLMAAIAASLVLQNGTCNLVT